MFANRSPRTLRRWIASSLAVGVVIGVGLWLQLAARRRPESPAVVSAPVPVRRAELPDTPPARGAGVHVVVSDHATGQPVGGTLVARDATGREVRAAIAPDGQGLVPIAPGVWSISARSLDGESKILVGATEWHLGENPPPWIEVRWAEAAPAPPSVVRTAEHRASLVGTATVEGVHPADLIVAPIWLAGYGSGRPSIPGESEPSGPIAPRRFVGTSGAWRLDDLPSGGYAIWVRVPRQAAALVTATATADVPGGASAALSPAAQVSGHVVDQRGVELADAAVHLRYGRIELARELTDHRGRFHFADLPAGEANFEVVAPGCFGERRTERLGAGSFATVKLALVCDAAAAP